MPWQHSRSAFSIPHPPLPFPLTDLLTRTLPILMPWQHSRSAFSIASPLRMMLTPQIPRANSTPEYGSPEER